MNGEFEFEPPIDADSLSGGADPKQQVDRKIAENDDPNWSVFDGESHHAPDKRELKQAFSVYVIELHSCETPDGFVELVERKHGREPNSYEWAAWHQDRVFYVGYTADPYKRLPEHRERKDSSDFLDIFPINQLREIRFAGNRREDALNLEETITHELDDQPGTFAHSDQKRTDR